MAKDTFYFSHDYNSRSDEKIKLLIRKHGILGYGIFWAIVEDLYNNANALRTDSEGIAFDLRVDKNVVESILNDFDLFVMKDDFFGSLSVERRLNDRNLKSVKARESANSRWLKAKEDANAMRTQCDSNAIKESKGKESKQNKDSIISISCFDFDSFWKMYGKSADKMKCQKLYDKITEKERADIKIKLPIYLSTIKDKKFQKNPHTYLFGKCWNDIDDISEIQSEDESQETLKELYPNCFWQINSKKIYYKPEWAK